MSPDSYNSEWVEAEINRAKELGRDVYPLLIRGKPIDSVPLSLASFQRIDMRKGFQEGMELLVRELTKQGLITSIVEPTLKSAEILTDDIGEISDTFTTPPESEQVQRKLSWLWVWLGVLLIAICVGIGWALNGDEISTMMATETHTPMSTFGKGSTLVREKDNMEMAFIPAGEFEMGSEDGDDSENPVHTVYLDAFWIDKYEVTNAQYTLCVQAGYCDVPDCSYYGNTEYDDHPVVCVNWEDAQEYADWVGGRLPTEAEWEKAARGGRKGQLYPWGNEDPTCTLGADNGAQFADCVGDTMPVGSFAPNGYGIYDMAGNIGEWVWDRFDTNYYDSSPYENPKGSSDAIYRVVRGGTFLSSQGLIRCAARTGVYPPGKNDNVGFRVVVSP
jgi:formylglycine-generating enzyme required for sulfatase activity